MLITTESVAMADLNNPCYKQIFNENFFAVPNPDLAEQVVKGCV